MGRKLEGGLCPFGGGVLGPHLTQCGLGRGLPHAKFELDPSNRLATVDMGKNWGMLYSPPVWGEVGSGIPSNTMWPAGLSSICTASFILIHPAVWPQYANVTNRHSGQIGDRQTDNGPTAYANRFTNGRPKIHALHYGKRAANKDGRLV